MFVFFKSKKNNCKKSHHHVYVCPSVTNVTNVTGERAFTEGSECNKSSHHIYERSVVMENPYESQRFRDASTQQPRFAYDIEGYLISNDISISVGAYADINN